MVSLMVGNPSGSGDLKTTFCLTAAMRLKEGDNDALIRLESIDINTSVVGKDKGRLSAAKEMDIGLADVVWLSVCPSKNPGPHYLLLLRRRIPNR